PSFKTAVYRFFTLVRNDDHRQVVAYAAYCMQGSRAVIVDVFCESFREQLAPLLLRLALQVRRDGAHSISLTFLGAEIVSRQLRALQFFRRADARNLVVSAGASLPASARAAVMDDSQWLVFEGDLDI